jgi:putative restriction endonuclease
VVVVDDHPDENFCHIAPEISPHELLIKDSAIEKSYARREAKVRLHQKEFRAVVLDAYGCKCAICSLKHKPLLEAAHITPDRDERSTAEVSNGLSLCRIHHTAYDVNILGISPDLTVHISESVLGEVDGPMLQHGIKDMHGRQIWVPSRQADKPDADRLHERFEQFLAVTA